ncbi:FeoC-like transcriptional regulator [Corynebacterium hansenii]|uniref:FeoC-like transcriptional regulator n=1 Tax=Corynebacterium hansenii TaxID=394964 RepID=A0ABV7ZV70_9CORY|nr:FeoC-like transcriptional regulator [Corynebacterium hansenii]WJY99817.1 FeoC like transcriptional regulator [Corynebacterium hansenii]
MSIFPANLFSRRRPVPAPAPGPARTPLSAVREAIASGEASRAEIAERTGLSRATVDAAIEHLERTGSLRRERMASSCPSGGCAHATADGGACSSSGNGAGERGPVALVLTRRP